MTPRAETPLTAEELASLRRIAGRPYEPTYYERSYVAKLLPRLLATLDAARSAPEPGLRAALEEAITLPLGGGYQMKQAEWRKVATEYDRAALSSQPEPAVCGCTSDAELGAGNVCPMCGHRDHGRSGCRAPAERAVSEGLPEADVDRLKRRDMSDRPMFPGLRDLLHRIDKTDETGLAIVDIVRAAATLGPLLAARSASEPGMENPRAATQSEGEGRATPDSGLARSTVDIVPERAISEDLRAVLEYFEREAREGHGGTYADGMREAATTLRTALSSQPEPEDVVDFAALLHDNEFSWDDANAVNAILTHHKLVVAPAERAVSEGLDVERLARAIEQHRIQPTDRMHAHEVCRAEAERIVAVYAALTASREPA